MRQRQVRFIFLPICLTVLLVSGILARGAVQSAWLNNRGSLHLLTEWQVYDDLSSLPRCLVWLKQTTARSWYEQALESNPPNQRAQLGLGRAAWLEGNCDEAVGHWNQALALDRQDIFADWEIANALYADGHTLQAMSSYRKVQAGPYFFFRGLRAAFKGDYAEAMRGYELSVALQPTRDSVQALAAAYLDMKYQPAEAKRLWLAFASTTQPDDPDHWWALGQAAEIDQQWTNALANYDQSIALQTHPYLLHIAYSQAGMVSMQVADYARGEVYLQKALSLQPKNMLTYLRLGELEQRQKRYEAAQDWYSRAAALDPESELPYYYLGLLFRELGNTVTTRQMFLHADQLNSRNSSVKFYLGLSAYEAGELSAAIALLEQAVALYPGTSIGWARMLGDWYLQAGRCPDAIALVKRLVESQPDSGDSGSIVTRVREACP